MPLAHIIYCSTPDPAFRESDIPALLEQARAANALRNISGMLLYLPTAFFQILEAEAVVVEETFGKIQLDPRHYRVTKIISESIAERSFADWSMGCSTLDVIEAGKLLGENDFFTKASCVSDINPGRAKKLLSSFQAGRRPARSQLIEALR